MTLVLELPEELAQKVEAQASFESKTPQQWLQDLAADATQNRYASREEFKAAQKEVFTEYARTFEILAEGAK